MRNLATSMVACWTVLVATMASAGNLSGNEMLEACEAPDESVMSGFCLGYVIGVVEGMKWGAALPIYAARKGDISIDDANDFANRLTRFCAPDSVTYGQYVDVFLKHLRQNPEVRHESARTLAQDAFSEAFPCIE